MFDEWQNNHREISNLGKHFAVDTTHIILKIILVDFNFLKGSLWISFSPTFEECSIFSIELCFKIIKLRCSLNNDNFYTSYFFIHKLKCREIYYYIHWLHRDNRYFIFFALVRIYNIIFLFQNLPVDTYYNHNQVTKLSNWINKQLKIRCVNIIL